MAVRPLSLIASAAMVSGFFLPWLSTPTETSLVPFDAIKGMNSTQILDMLSNLPPEGIAFFSSIGLAALLVLLGLMGAAPRLIVLLTGAIALGYAGWVFFSATTQGSALGTPMSSTDPIAVAEQIAGIMGPGAWAWLGGGTLLFLMGIFAPGSRR